MQDHPEVHTKGLNYLIVIGVLFTTSLLQSNLNQAFAQVPSGSTQSSSFAVGSPIPMASPTPSPIDTTPKSFNSLAACEYYLKQAMTFATYSHETGKSNIVREFGTVIQSPCSSYSYTFSFEQVNIWECKRHNSSGKTWAVNTATYTQNRTNYTFYSARYGCIWNPYVSDTHAELYDFVWDGSGRPRLCTASIEEADGFIHTVYDYFDPVTNIFMAIRNRDTLGKSITHEYTNTCNPARQTNLYRTENLPVQLAPIYTVDGPI